MSVQGEPIYDRVDCPQCGGMWRVGEFTGLVGIEYVLNDPNAYDGISEWMCPHCGTRWGRWTGKILAEGDIEPRYGGRKA